MSDDIFWTGIDQANERLLNTVVMYEDRPCFIQEILSGRHFDDGKIRASVRLYGQEGREETRKLLSSPKFKRFKNLPSLGWVNLEDQGEAVFIMRNARRTRSHGLSSNNVVVMDLQKKSADFKRSKLMNFASVYQDVGYYRACNNIYPSLDKILAMIDEKQVIAYSSKFAVQRDNLGFRWLLRDTERIGLFTGANTLNIINKFSFYREEIMEDPLFTLENIKEY